MITDIYKLHWIKDKFSYIGCLRNQKKFAMGDNVFFSVDGHDILKGKIVGIELLPTENPEYEYKVEMQKEAVESKIKESMREDRFTLICDRIFESIEEAEESAYKNLEHLYKLQMNEIKTYFSQFKNNKLTFVYSKQKFIFAEV